jgi:prepilin-type N-terminal cleavage/methylation domain-containing protein
VRRQGGFTLVELLVTITITLGVLAGTVVAMTNAMRASETAKAMTGMNSNLRVGMDMMVRDLIQVGQGLPTGRVVSVPNGDGAAAIVRPGPPGTDYTFDAGSPVISAVTVGPGLGPMVNGQPTDMITVLAADTSFEGVDVTAIGATSATIDAAVNISDGGADDVREGDVIMLTGGSLSALMYVTGTNGGQTISFDAGDPLSLNQYDPGLEMLGTLDQLRASNPTSPQATRIRMISYYVDAATDPASPRLVRRLNADPGRTVAFAVETLSIAYDLADGAVNPANVRMDATDLDGGGACSPNPCSPNQVRKVNVFLSGRSQNRFALTDRFLRNSLTTQVSLRSLAFVDRYR